MVGVIRVEKNQNYTVMSNYHLSDKNLTLKAIGLLSKILSLPDDWDYSINGLASICKEEKKAIRNTLKELENNGYLKREMIKDEKGRFDYDYIIYEEPHILEPCTQEPYALNGYADDGYAEKGTQLNTNQLNTKKENTKKQKSEFDIALEEFEKMRRRIRKPLTDRAKELVLKKLDDLADTEEEKIEILNQSILNSWQGVFPLNNDTKKKGNNLFNDDLAF